jgi:hypothetical protein
VQWNQEDANTWEAEYALECREKIKEFEDIEAQKTGKSKNVYHVFINWIFIITQSSPNVLQANQKLDLTVD